MKRKRVMMVMHAYNPQIHMGVVKYAHEANWILQWYRYNTDALPNKWHGEGILCLHSDNDKIVNFIYHNSLPTVDMGWRNSKIKLPQVTVDNSAIGEMGAKYFISKGFKNVAFILAFDDPTHTYYNRFKSFKDSFSRKGFTFTRLDLKNPMPIIRSLPKPLAIMAQDDRRAVVAQNAFLHLNYRIPEDIAILGVDNDKFDCELAPIPLSSIDSNLFGSGYKAAELLDKMMDGLAPPEEAIFIPPVKVVERMSTDIFAIDHSNVSKALKEIHNRYKEQLSIDQIAIKAGMSRRRLDDAFFKHLGHSIFDELTKVRLGTAKKLLTDTDLKIEAIAYESGFSNLRHLERVFLRVERMKPSVFRKQF